LIHGVSAAGSIAATLRDTPKILPGRPYALSGLVDLGTLSSRFSLLECGVAPSNR
jgi:hypothetical protein